MKIIDASFLSITLFLSACDARNRDSEPTAHSNQQQKLPTPASKGFLGLADDESKKIGDDSPDSALARLTSITEVRSSTPEEYERARADGRIKSQETRGGYMYYAVEQIRHAPFPNGSSAYFTVTERFKTKLPNQR